MYIQAFKWGKNLWKTWVIICGTAARGRWVIWSGQSLVWDVKLWLGPKGGLGAGWQSGSVVSPFHRGMDWLVQSHLRTSPADARS